MLRFFVFFWGLLLIAIPAYASLSGRVWTRDGQMHQGDLFMNRSLRFKEIFSKEVMTFEWEKIAKIDVIKEATEERTVLEPKRTTRSRTTFLLAVTTWQGKRFWGYCAVRVTLTPKDLKPYEKKKKFFLPHITKGETDSPFFIAKIVFESSKHSLPRDENFPGLHGKVAVPIAPEGMKVFDKVYLLHRKLPIVFQAPLKQNHFTRLNMLPGHYDIFLVGPKAIVFFLSVDRRTAILDRPAPYAERSLRAFVNQHHEDAALMHFMGYYSNTRAIVGNQQKIWLWICQRQAEKWRLDSQTLLYQAKGSTRTPRLMIDPRLGNIYLSPTSAVKKFSYIIK